MDRSHVIDVQDLRKVYREGWIRRKSIEALRGVSLQVGRGEIFGLLGPNGAGKTTLIKVLLGIVRKSGGEAQMLEAPVGTREIRRQIGYLPESHRIPRHLTAYSALEYYGGLSGVPAGKVRLQRDDLLNTVGLQGWGKTPVRKFSKGMQQRLGLAQAMLHDPELLVLDEPTDGVDPVGRTEIRDVLKQLKDRGKTVFLNSHLLQELELVCDRVAILNHGRVRTVGKLEEVTHRPENEATFLLEDGEDAIRESLQGYEILQWQPIDERRFRVTLAINEQQTVDHCIDALRQRRVSIHSITRRKLTLEQAFLELIKEGPPQT